MKHMHQNRQMIAGAVLTVFLLLLSFLAPKLAAQSADGNCSIKKSMAYTSSEFQWTVRAPKKWEGNYRVCEKGTTESFPVNFEFSVRKNRRTKFTPVFTLHVWDTARLNGKTVTGTPVSQKDTLAVTSDLATGVPASFSKYTKDIPDILKGFRWVNFGQLGDFMKKL